MTSLHCCLKTAFEKDTAGYRGNPLLKQNFDSDRQIETAVNDPTKGLKPKPTFNQAMAQIEADRAYVENMYDQARSEAPKLKRQSLRKLMYNDILLKTLEKEKQKRAKFLAFGMTPDEIMQARRQERDNMVTEAVNTPFDQLPEHIRARIHANGGMTALQADGMSFDEYRNAIEQAVAGVPQDQLNLLSAQANDGSSDLSSLGGSSDSSFNIFLPDTPITYSNMQGEGAVVSGAGSGQGGQGTTYVPPPRDSSGTLLSPRSPVSRVASGSLASPGLQQPFEWSADPFADMFDEAFAPGASERAPLPDAIVGDTRPIASANTDIPSGHLRPRPIPPPIPTNKSSRMFSPSSLFTVFVQTDLDRDAKLNGFATRQDFINGVGTKAIRPMVERFLQNQGFSVPDREDLVPKLMAKVRELATSSAMPQGAGAGSSASSRGGRGRGGGRGKGKGKNKSKK